MAVEIVVPALGQSISEAIIAKWYKKPGEIIAVDDLLLELETEKVTLEVNSHAAGRLDKILESQGETVSAGEIIGLINQQLAIDKAQQPIINWPEEFMVSTEPAKKINPVTSAPASMQELVSKNNLNQIDIRQSDQDNRISKEDPLQALDTDPSSVRQLIPTNTDKPVERVKMPPLRQTIAQRLTDCQNTAAILTTFNELDMTNIINLRQKYRQEFNKKHGIKLGYMSFFIKASIEALKLIPAMNAEIDGNDILYKNYYDIGVAVGTKQGLVVPVLRHSDQLTFAAIEREIANLANKAKEGKLSIADLLGGTFSITNGGIYGSLLSTPIINPPQSGILGLHKIQERAVTINGKIEVRSMMYVALSYDHRIVEGREAVTFLVKIKEAIENPERLLLNI